jgi:hypothetical protein
MGQHSCKARCCRQDRHAYSWRTYRTAGVHQQPQHLQGTCQRASRCAASHLWQLQGSFRSCQVNQTPAEFSGLLRSSWYVCSKRGIRPFCRQALEQGLHTETAALYVNADCSCMAPAAQYCCHGPASKVASHHPRVPGHHCRQAEERHLPAGASGTPTVPWSESAAC